MTATTDAAPSPQHELDRIQVLGERLRGCNLIAAALVVFFMLVFTLVGGIDIFIHQRPFNFAGTDTAHRVLGLMAMLASAIPLFLIQCKLHLLFDLYSSGTVFARANIECLRGIGRWLMWWPVFDAAGNLTISAILTQAGKADGLSLDGPDLIKLFLGGFVYLLAHVMTLANAAEEERAQFV
jgi:hypothetical protein